MASPIAADWSVGVAVDTPFGTVAASGMDVGTPGSGGIGQRVRVDKGDGLSGTDLSEMTELRGSRPSDMERGPLSPTIPTPRKLGDSLGPPLVYFLHSAEDISGWGSDSLEVLLSTDPIASPADLGCRSLRSCDSRAATGLRQAPRGGPVLVERAEASRAFKEGRTDTSPTPAIYLNALRRHEFARSVTLLAHGSRLGLTEAVDIRSHQDVSRSPTGVDRRRPGHDPDPTRRRYVS